MIEWESMATCFARDESRIEELVGFGLVASKVKVVSPLCNLLQVFPK